MLISEDARIVKDVGTKIAIISIPMLAGSAIVACGMNYPPANVDLDKYVQAFYIDIAALGIGAGALYLGLTMREKAENALKFVQNHSPKQ